MQIREQPQQTLRRSSRPGPAGQVAIHADNGCNFYVTSDQRCSHRTLMAAGTGDYSWDALWNDYRLSVVKRLCTPICHWANGIAPAVWSNNLERTLTAYEDLGYAEIMAQLNGA